MIFWVFVFLWIVFFAFAWVAKFSGSDDLAAVFLYVSVFFTGSMIGWDLREKRMKKK